MADTPFSTTTSRTSTVHEHDSPTPTLAQQDPMNKARTGLFSEPGSIPLPNHGYHSLGVSFEDVTVYGSGGTKKTVEDFPKAMVKASFLLTFDHSTSTDHLRSQMWDVPGFVSKLFNLKFGAKRPLISNVSGVLPSGELMLVLGRPGSGCSTLLRAIANQRDSFAQVDGELHYGKLDAEQAKAFSGEIVFNGEDDIHSPLLTVEQTLGSALTLKKPHVEPVKRGHYANDLTSRLLNAFGMPHTARTKVGDAFIRGVSGGERKRVSLAEHLTTNAAISCWDNSIRGLDSAVALQYMKVLRELANSTGSSHAISIYQASEGMYSLMDRVAVLYEGQLVFMGRAEDAQPFFERQGWLKNPRQTTPDFLTSCTSVTERKVRPGHADAVPQTPEEMALYFRNSPYWSKLQSDIASYKAHHASSDDTEQFISAVRASKEPLTGKKNPYKTSFFRQTWQLVKVQLALQKADPRNIIVRLSANALNALNLLGAQAEGAAGAGKSPYVIAMNRQIPILPDIVNAGIFTSVLSAGNAYFFSATRSLAQLSKDGHAPSFITNVNRNGVPYISVSICLGLLCLSYCQVSADASVFIDYLVNISSAGQLVNWVLMSITWIRWNKARHVQGLSRDSLPCRSRFQPYAAYYSLICSVLVTLLQGYTVFLEDNWSTPTFIFAYGMPVIYIILFVGWKLLKRTKLETAQSADVTSFIDDPEFTEEVDYATMDHRGRIGNLVHRFLYTFF
ncbi:hypothetical protein JCM8547_008193 [Rhodosporidiobolus lusitaniae]